MKCSAHEYFCNFQRKKVGLAYKCFFSDQILDQHYYKNMAFGFITNILVQPYSAGYFWE